MINYEKAWKLLKKELSKNISLGKKQKKEFIKKHHLPEAYESHEYIMIVGMVLEEFMPNIEEDSWED